jgi:hypothetical protein
LAAERTPASLVVAAGIACKRKLTACSAGLRKRISVRNITPPRGVFTNKKQRREPIVFILRLGALIA